MEKERTLRYSNGGVEDFVANLIIAAGDIYTPLHSL